MRFGTAVFPDMPVPDALAWGQDAAASGFELIGIPDSPILIRETYVTCAALLASTSSGVVAPMVTNPVTRHPSVAAGALITLNELAPGRIGMGIGGGDSAVYGVGRKAGTLERIRAYVDAVKQMLRGETAEYEGREFRAEWKHWDPDPDIKIWISCHGPKSMRMAGAVADGVISGHGMRPENIRFVIDEVAAGARESGRDPSEVEIWWHPFVTLAETADADVFTGMTAHFLARGGIANKQVPEELQEPITILAAEAGRFETHGRHADLAARARELGVFDYLLEREGGLVGSPEEMAARISELGRLGAENLLLAPLGPDGHAMMRRLVNDVLPLV